MTGIPPRDAGSSPPSDVTGQQYSLEGEQAAGARLPSGHPLTGDPARVDRSGEDAAGRDIPPDNGRRASFDAKTGEVHGSGSGAGGGNEGEDLDEETSGGS